MKRPKITSLLIASIILILSSCQSLTETAAPTLPAPTSTVIQLTATSQPPTETATVTPTLVDVTPASLAGLVISSPILGSPYEVPGVRPPETITPNGLGIINSAGELIQFSDAGLFVGFSPSGRKIVYQHGFEDEMTDYIDNLYVYNLITGETIEIMDDLKDEGGKTVLSWLPGEQKFIYYNDYLTVLFEAYGYFDARQLLLADVAIGETRLLVNGYQFDDSPDQTQIAYTTGKILDREGPDEKPERAFGCFQPHLYNMVSSSSKPFDISQLAEKPVCLGYPKWSPDGKKIAWMGYFEDDTFRPIVFNLQDKTGKVYSALDQKPENSLLPTFWFFGEPAFGDYMEPDWVDNTTFWTPSYEVNVETQEVSAPREIDLPYSPGRDESIESPDGLFTVSLDEERDALILKDMNENVLASFFLDDIYDGTKHEILMSPFFLSGVTKIVGWSPFIP